MTEIIFTGIIILLLLSLGAYFASTETAFTSLSRITIRQMQKSDPKNGEKLLKLKNNLNKVIATVLIGTNFVNTLNSSLVTAFTIKLFGDGYVTYATTIITFIIIIFVEIIPKSYAAFKTKETAISSANLLIFLQIILFPIIWIFTGFSNLIEKLEHLIFKTKKQLLTQEELKTLIDVGKSEGTLEQNESKMLGRIFEFSDLNVHDIMKHRSFVKYINIHDSFENVIKLFNSTGFSRIPVYEDDIENIVGVLHYKNVLYANSLITESKDFVRICMEHVTFISESMSAVDLLKIFKKDKINFAVVINEYGSMAGIVTLDDILREVFGRITDEHGSVEAAPEKRIKVVNVNEFIIPGDLKLEDYNNLLNMNLSSENFDTIGGWLLERFGELPSIGRAYKSQGVLYTIEDQSSRRIQTIRVRL